MIGVIVKEWIWQGDVESVFSSIYQERSGAFWLDGNRIMEGLGRYSFLGCEPKFVVFIREGKLHIQTGRHVEILPGDPFYALQQVLDRYSVSRGTLPHLPFIGGLVGCFGYEMVRYIEDVPTHELDSGFFCEGYWGFYDRILIVDQVENKAYLTCLLMDGVLLDTIETEAEAWMDRIQRISKVPSELLDVSDIDSTTLSFEQTETSTSYGEKINQIKEYITRGQVYQVCLTQRFKISIDSMPYRIYQILRRINPAPFSCYLKMGSVEVLSSSPERFLKMDVDGIVESRPIKGTRPRSEDPDYDRKLKEELQFSEKDRAENVMIVDLVRNDLGRICSHVDVPRLLDVESYATVHQLVSIVRGDVVSGAYRAMDVVRAAFPGGSMTGAPKVSAMGLIHHLEDVSRGIYSGGLGYLDVRGSFDLSMVIRTLICEDGEATFHVGGGIVIDSVAKDEYEESLDKAYALKKALAIAERMNGFAPQA